MLTDTDNQNLQSNYPVERFSIKVINTRVINTNKNKIRQICLHRRSVKRSDKLALP